MKKTTKKATKKKARTANSSIGRSVLYANLADINHTWVGYQAKKAGVSKSIFTDALIQFAKKNNFKFTQTGRA